MAEEGNPVSVRKESRNSAPSLALSGSNSTVSADGSSKKRNPAIKSSKSISATTGKNCKTKRKCEESKEADCDAVPAKKKGWKKSSKEDDSNKTIWSQLGAFKCDKCGFTTTDEGVYNSHVCSTKRFARTPVQKNLPRPISRGAFSVSLVTNSSQFSACPVQTTCSPSPVTSTFKPQIVSSTPRIPFVCSSETVCTPSPLTNSTESTLGQQTVVLPSKTRQTPVCSSETVTMPSPVMSSLDKKTGELRIDVPAIPLQATVCSETVCAPAPVKSTAGQPGNEVSSVPLQAAVFSSETACTPAPVTGNSVQPRNEGHSVPPQATVCSAKSLSPVASRSESETRQQGTSQTISQLNTQGTEKSQQRQGFIRYDQNTQLFVCMQCRYSAVQGNSLSEHLIYQISANPYNCRLCKTGYATRSDFQKHFLESHTGKKMECELRRVKEVKKILSNAREAAMSGKPHAFSLHPEFKDCIKQSTFSAIPKTASLSQSAPSCKNSSLNTPQMPSTSVCSQTNSCKAVEDQNQFVNESEKSCNSAGSIPLHDDNHCSSGSQKSQAWVSVQSFSCEQNVQALNESEISSDRPDHVSSSESRTADCFHSGQHSSCTSDAAAEQTKASQQEQCVTTPPFSTGYDLISTDQAEKEPHTDVAVQPSVKAGKQSTASSTQSSGISESMARNKLQSKTGIENTMSESDNQVAQEKGGVPNHPRPVERADSKITSQRGFLPVISAETADAGILPQRLYSPVSSFASTSPTLDAGIVPQRLYSPISSFASTSPDNLSVSGPLSPFPISSDQTCSAVTPPPVSTPAAAFVPISPPSVHRPPAAVSPISPPPVNRPTAAFSPVTPVQSPRAAVSPLTLPPILSPQITVSQTIPPSITMPPAAVSSVTHLAVITSVHSPRSVSSLGTPPPVLSPHATVSSVEPPPAVSANTPLPVSAPPIAVSPITPPPVTMPPAAVSPITPSPVYTLADPGQPMNVSISEQADHFELRAQTGKVFAVSSPSLHRQEVAGIYPQSRDGSCSSTGVGHQTAQVFSSLSVPLEDKGNLVQSQSNASMDSFSPDDFSERSLCSSYFVKFFDTFACLPCSKRLTNKEMFYEHVWDHLHTDGQCCNMCRNTSEKSCVRAREMADSVSSVVDAKLLLKLTDNCRRRLSLKLVAENNSPLNRHTRESESPTSTTCPDAQLSGSRLHVDALTDQNMQEGSSESVQQLNVFPTTVHPATEDVSSMSESTVERGQEGERVTEFEEQNVRNSPVLLSTVSRNETEKEHGSNDRQILDGDELEQENGSGNGQTSTGNGAQESDLVNRQRMSENEVEQESGLADRGVSITAVNDEGGQLEQVAEDIPSENCSILQAGHESSEESCSNTDLDNCKEAEEDNAQLEENAILDVCHANSHLGTALNSSNGGRITEMEEGSERVGANSTMQLSEDSRKNEDNSLHHVEGEKPQSTGSKSSTTNSVFYICSLCNFSCAKAIDFTFHLNFHHHHEPSFPCFHCNYHGKYTTDLSNHMSDHTAGDSNIFVCPCCDKCSYTTNSLPGLRQHLETHKDCQAFRCHRCETTFMDSTGFVQHAQRDMITLSTCSQCDSRFLDKTAMQHHWRTKHSGGLVIKVQKILLCLERKTNDYWTTRSRKMGKDDYKGSVDEDQISTPVKSLQSVTANNSEVDKSAAEGQVSGAEDQSGLLDLGQVSVSRTVVGVEKGSASETRREGSPFSEISGDAALRNDSAQSENIPESAGKTVDDSALSTQKEPSSVSQSKGESRSEDENKKFGVLSIPDQNEAASSHLDIGDELEREDGATEMIRNQSDHAEGASISHQPVTTGVLTVDGHTVENESMDCHQESWQPWQRNAPAYQSTTTSSVTNEQAYTSASDHETALPSEFSDTNSTNSLPSEVPEREVMPASDSADIPAKDGQGMTKLTALFGSRELHCALSDQMYRENANQFCCVICEKLFNRLASIHGHLFTAHFHVPLFSCVFCFYKSESQRDLKKHIAEKHPLEKCQINCLMVDRNHLLQSLEKAKPLTIMEFKTICHQLKDGNRDSENRLTLDLRSEENNKTTAREEAEVINQAHDVRHESDTTVGTTPSCAAGHGDICMKKPSAAEKTVSSYRSETSSAAKESEEVKQIDSPKSNGATVVQRDEVDKDHPSETTAFSSRTENDSANSQAKTSRPAFGNRRCEEKSFSRSTSAPQRKNVDKKSFKDVSECHEHNVGKGSKKKKGPVGPKKGTTYTIEKGKFLSKYKCKACNYKALSVNSVIKHQETCKRFINMRPISEQTDFAGLLAKQLQRTQTSARTFHVTGKKDSASVQSEKASKILLGPVNSGSHSEILNQSKQSKRQRHFKRKVQRLSPKGAKIIEKTSSLQSGKSRLAEELHETVLKEAGQAENVCDAFSLGSERKKKESMSKDVGGGPVGVSSAEDENDDAKIEDDDFSPRRPTKRRTARRLVISSDENDSREESGSDKNLEMEKENRTGIEPEQIAQCKLCDFAAPSSQVNELEDHLQRNHEHLAVLMKCGYCSAPYGNSTTLKKHINSVHRGLPVLQDRVPYGEFYRILENGKSSQKSPIKQQAGKAWSEPCIKRIRAHSPIMILDDEVETENSGKHKEGNEESKTADCHTGRSSLLPTPNKSPVVELEDFKATSDKAAPKPKGTGLSLNSESSSQKRSDNSVSSVSKKTSHGENDGTHRSESLVSSSVDDTDMPANTSTKAAVPGSEKMGCGVKESGQKQSSTSDVKNKTKGSLTEKQCRDDKGKDSSRSKRYHCVKCTQVHLDYRSIFLHMSRHLRYSPYRCGLCHMEFFTADEVKIHHDKKHHEESFSQSVVSDRKLEEEIARLVTASLVEGVDKPQASAQDTKDMDKKKQTVQCRSCQAELESLSVLKRHCTEEHGLVSKAKMLWKDVSSQVVYNLHGQPADGKTASHVHVFPYLCGFCSLRFRNRESATAHSQKKHSDKKHGWIVQLRASSPASLKTSSADGSAPAAGSQKENSEAQKGSTSHSVRDGFQNSPASKRCEQPESETCAESSRDSFRGSSSSMNALKRSSTNVDLATHCKRRKLHDDAVKTEPVVVLTDLLKTDRIDEVMLINGISSIHAGDNLSDEAHAFFMKFAPQ